MIIKYEILVANRIDSYTLVYMSATAADAVQPFLLQFMLLFACDHRFLLIHNVCYNLYNMLLYPNAYEGFFMYI